MEKASSSKRIAEEESNVASPKKVKTDSQEEVKHFARLFNEAFEFMQKTMKVSEEELLQALIIVIQTFKSNRLTEEDPAYLCAYFYRYSQLWTELSRSRILEAIGECEVLRQRLDGNDINIVSVGGGPGCDIVGLFSAFYEKIKLNKLNITVVDNFKSWKSFLNIVEVLLREGDYGNASKIIQETDVSISFMYEDVCKTETQSAEYLKALENADVVVMKSLLSILSFREGETAVQNVVRNMKNGAMLLYIDSPERSECFDDRVLEKIYTSFEKSSEQEFYIQGSPIKTLGRGLADHSKAKTKLFMKKVL